MPKERWQPLALRVGTCRARGELRALVKQLQRLDATEEEADYHDEIERIRQGFLRRRSTWQRECRQALAAAIHVIVDLVKQGWRFRLVRNRLEIIRSDSAFSVGREERRTKLHAQRNEQLRERGTREFVREVERTRLHGGARVSIFSLMRDGRELAARLRATNELTGVISPSLQFVREDAVCDKTGLRLLDIWRYFRHTWANPYQSVPGRTMMFLVRDTAAPMHPVMGIGALSSAAVKLKARDEFIGWDSEQVAAVLQQDPTPVASDWLRESVRRLIDDLYLTDILADALLTTRDIDRPTEPIIQRLEAEARREKDAHQRLMAGNEYKGKAQRELDEGTDEDGGRWEAQARTPLFRSKRCADLAALLRVRLELAPLAEGGESGALAAVLSSATGRKAVAQVVRRIRAQRIGTAIADLTVCGAVPPYNALLAGKLTAMLAVSPPVVNEYRRRYGESTSIIASSMAGRPVQRPADLVFIGTTSLYGLRPCQYDRIAIPASVFQPGASGSIKYHFIDETEGWGTFQFGKAATAALAEFVRAQRNGAQVNYVFGEGTSPKLRALRDGLTRLGFDTEPLLHHGMRRLIYGVPLITNLTTYLLGMDSEPHYVLPKVEAGQAVSSVVGWWLSRWVAPRLRQETLSAIERHTLVHPITHGGRVPLPSDDLWQQQLL